MKKVKFTSLAFIVLLLSVMLAFSACNPAEEKAAAIAITKEPIKLEYAIGEEIDFTGGEVTATFEDGSTSVAALTDDDVTISSVNTSKAGKKSVTVTYQSKRVRFNIFVNPYIVSFDMGGVGEAIEPVEVKMVGPIDEMPQNPEAEGYVFDGWFTNAELSDPFDENMEISSDYTLYAKWRSTAKDYFTVVFDQNYYGAPKNKKLSVEDGQTAAAPTEPTRVGYEFDGWFTSPDGDTVFDFTAPITSDATAYAHWHLTATGTNEYVFEAENIDLNDKLGHGYSGERMGGDMAMEDMTKTASGGYFLGYTYTAGMTFDFRFASDRDAQDATIVVRLSGEFADFVLTPDMFSISLNGTPIDYGDIAILNVPKGGSNKEFEDYVLTVNASLLEGANVITMSVDNNVNWIGGGTVQATAPLIDCIKITTDAVLWWDGTFGYPVKNT